MAAQLRLCTVDCLPGGGELEPHEQAQSIPVFPVLDTDDAPQIHARHARLRRVPVGALDGVLRYMDHSTITAHRIAPAINAVRTAPSTIRRCPRSTRSAGLGRRRSFSAIRARRSGSTRRTGNSRTSRSTIWHIPARTCRGRSPCSSMPWRPRASSRSCLAADFFTFRVVQSGAAQPNYRSSTARRSARTDGQRRCCGI